MANIAVLITMHFDNSQGNFEELRQKEMAHVMKWKAEGLLETFFIKSEKNGSMLIFKDLDMAQVVKNVEGLPFFPHMENVEYLALDKIF